MALGNFSGQQCKASMLLSLTWVTIAQIPAFVDFIRGTDSSKSTCSISFISPRTKIWLGDELGATGA